MKKWGAVLYQSFCSWTNSLRTKIKIKVDLPHCPQVSIVRLSSSFHFLPRPISLADGNRIINNPWFWNLLLREVVKTILWSTILFLGSAIIVINLAKVPQEGNCSNRLFWRATLKGKKDHIAPCQWFDSRQWWCRSLSSTTSQILPACPLCTEVWKICLTASLLIGEFNCIMHMRYMMMMRWRTWCCPPH